MRLTCAVTGANGYLGRNLVRYFWENNIRVIALTRNPHLIKDVEARKFTLGERIAPETLNGVDILIHAAYDFSLRNWAEICRVNVLGSEHLFDAALRSGVKRQIFISSMSAFEGCRSLYGKGKLVTENAICVRGGMAIRPGMVYGKDNRGIAGLIANAAKRFPVLPMIGKGNYPLYTSHIDDLCNLTLKLMHEESSLSGIYTAANETPITLMDMVRLGAAGKPRFIIATPWSWIAGVLWLMERFGLRLKFRSDSVVSLAHTNPEPDFSALKKFGVQFRNWPEKV